MTKSKARARRAKPNYHIMTRMTEDDPPRYLAQVRDGDRVVIDCEVPGSDGGPPTSEQLLEALMQAVNAMRVPEDDEPETDKVVYEFKIPNINGGTPTKEQMEEALKRIVSEPPAAEETHDEADDAVYQIKVFGKGGTAPTREEVFESIRQHLA